MADDNPQDVAMRNGSEGQHVRAERVEISQTGVNRVEATTVSVQQGGAGNVRAEQVSIAQGGVGMARTGSLNLGAGASGLLVVAEKAKVEQGASVFMLLASDVEGDVRPVLDWRAAAAFGVGLAIGLSLIGRALR